MGHGERTGAKPLFGHNGLPMGQQMVAVDLVAHGGPHAQPIATALPTPGGITVHTWGGFTKLEAAAVAIAAGLVANSTTKGAEPKDIGSLAAIMAEQTLIACSELVNLRTEEAKDGG